MASKAELMSNECFLESLFLCLKNQLFTLVYCLLMKTCVFLVKNREMSVTDYHSALDTVYHE